MKSTADALSSSAGNSATPIATPRRGLADAMRARASELHTQAEQSGIVGAILTGQATRAGYALLLRNLLPAYRELEAGLARHRQSPIFSGLCRPEIFRAAAIASDLARLSGDDWMHALPLLPAGDRYADRIATAAQGDGSLLIAHAYTRYLGDLAGGRLLKRCLAKIIDDAACLSFYDFPELGDLGAFAGAYRAAIDATAELVDVDPVIEEAAVAFQHNIELSKAVHAQLGAADGFHV